MIEDNCQEIRLKIQKEVKKMLNAPNAPKYSSLDSLQKDPRSYLTGGCEEFDLLAGIAIKVLYGEDKDNNLRALPYGTFGRSAVTAVIRALGARKHVVVSKDIFPETWKYLKTTLPHYGGQVSFVDINNPLQLEAAIRPETTLVWLETVSNPLFVVADLQKVIETVKKNPFVIIGVDDTLLAGLTISGRPFSPLRFGAHLVAYSLTKHAAGWGDERGGIVIGYNLEMKFPIAGESRLMEALREIQRLEGTHIHPKAAIKLSRRIIFLSERQRRACQNALLFARIVEKDVGKDVKIYYPGLASHPTHEFARKNGLDEKWGYGGLVTIDVGSMERARKMGNLLAEAGVAIPSNSFGEKETLCTIVPPSMLPTIKAMGIPEGIIRISFGWGKELSEIIEEQAKETARIIKKIIK